MSSRVSHRPSGFCKIGRAMSFYVVVVVVNFVTLCLFKYIKKKCVNVAGIPSKSGLIN